MCGICGVLLFKENTVGKDTIKAMCGIIKHRGPDDEAFFSEKGFAMGMRRLSIIDLRKGIYPLHNENKTLALLYNGEIYNYEEVREDLVKKGHEFKTDCDGEVVVHAFEEYGEKCLDVLNGMFAIALYDAKKKELFLARDRLGIKPLYYYKDRDCLVFASEIKAILASGLVEKKINEQAVLDYFTFADVTGGKTFFQNIFQLQPGHFLKASSAGLEIREYWDVKFSEKDASKEECVKQYERLLHDSVKKQLMSDVPLGCYLSGGIDSSSVVAFASQHLKGPLNTYTGAFKEGPEYDERKYAHIVAEKVASKQHDVVISAEDFAKALPEVIWHLDEPKLLYGQVPQYLVAGRASKDVRVILTGHGGDELFGSYHRYYWGYLNDMNPLKRAAAIRFFCKNGLFKYYAASFMPSKFLKYASHANNTDKARRFTPGFLEKVREYDPFAYYKQLAEKSGTKSRLNQMLYIDIKAYLPSLLVVEDKISMAHSLESRVPILDHRIVEFAAGIPPRLKMRGSEMKDIPKQALKKLLPKEIIEHTKLGFPTPVSIWFKKDIRKYVEKILLDNKTLSRGILNPEFVKQTVQENAAGKNRDLEIWLLLSFELWARTFIDRPGQEPVTT